MPKPRPVGREAFVVSAFIRLARTHAASVAGEAAVAVALAGSLFFSIEPDQARWKVVLYLLLTLAPFAVVAPLVGPAIDRVRSGARWVVLGTLVVRSFVAFLLMSHIDGLLLFPLAFVLLISSKGYAVAKSAYVPSTVARSDQLVEANSRLGVLSAVAGPAGGAPAAALAWLVGSKGAMGAAMVFFGLGAVLAARLAAAGGPGVAEGSAEPTQQKRSRSDRPWSALLAEFRARPRIEPAVWLGASAMGLVRLVTGFLTFFVAFELRGEGSSLGYGLVLGSAGAGAVGGSFLAPIVRRRFAEERMLAGALIVMAIGGVMALLAGGIVGAMIVAATVAVLSTSAKQAFDALVQRETPPADTGRVFAQYEARFQVIWVIGALPPALLPIPWRLGFAMVALAGAVGAATYLMGRQVFDIDRIKAFAGFGPAPGGASKARSAGRTSTPRGRFEGGAPTPRGRFEGGAPTPRGRSEGGAPTPRGQATEQMPVLRPPHPAAGASGRPRRRADPTEVSPRLPFDGDA